MAFAGSIAPRRKITTYGKQSRRLTSTLNSATEIEFAQDAGANISSTSDPGGINRHWQGYGRNASSNLLHGHSGTEVGSENFARQALSMPRDQLRSSSGRSDSARDGSLYDLPVSDDDAGHNTNVARKRRKITPSKVTVDKQSPVYDDESLQRHIAAEAYRDEGQIMRSPSIKNFGSGRCAMNKQATAPDSLNNGIIETTNDVTLDPKHSAIPVKAVEQIKGPLGPEKKAKAPPRAKVTSRRTQNTTTDPAKTTARPTTPDTVSDRVYLQEAASDHRSPHTSRKSVYQPTTTPPSSTGATGRATTPRQRELWNRLLENNMQVNSPSSLSMNGLIIIENKPEILQGYAKSRKVSWGPHHQPATLKARPKKIVDTLHRSEQDYDHPSDDCDEARGGSSSDNKSEYMHSELSATDGAFTMQTSPSADSQGLVSQLQDHFPNASRTIPSLYGGLKVTYARQRSYLTDLDLEEAAMTGSPIPPESNNGRNSGLRRLQDRITQTQSMNSPPEEVGDLADPQGGTMRSIHELREAGGHVRLVSELEAILDDIGECQPGSTSLRRSKLIDLVTKLEEPANCRRFVDRGLETRLIADIGLGNDLISNGLLVAALSQLMSLSSSALLLTQVGDVRVVRFLIDLLGSDQDLLSYARLRGNNLSKAALADFQNLCSALLRSTAWRAGKPSVLSCHVLALQCLENFVRQTREAGSLSEVLSAYAIRRIVATTVPPFSTSPPQPDEISVVCLELAVSILESCTISNAAECQASLWAGETLERVIGLLPLLSLWKGEGCGMSRTLTLRLYLNLTNNSPGLCEDFSTPEVISVMFRIVVSHFEQLAGSTLEIDKTLLLDDLILTLGSLINLADLSKIARQLVMDLRYRSQSYLDTFIELFMNKSKNAAEVRISCATAQTVTLTRVGFLARRDQL